MMKYLLPLLVILLAVGSVFATRQFLPEVWDDCCEYLGLLAPEGVSEVPGQAHVSFRGAGELPPELPGMRIGDSAGEIRLPDLDGNPLHVNFGAADWTVITFVSGFCPTSKIYEERLNDLAREFSGKAQFFGINSAAMESMEELRAHFRDGAQDRLAIPVLKDEGNVIADRLGAQVSAECFVFDRQGRLQYRGGIDDARAPTHVKTRFLYDAMKDLVAGKSPRWRFQPPNGCCPIDRVNSRDEQNPTSAEGT
jgi:hypothetical protein